MRTAAAMPENDVTTHAFRALDPQLPLLAAKAAVQLDNIRLWLDRRLSEPPRRDAVIALVERLTGTLQDARRNARTLFDPITERVFSSALAQSCHGQQPAGNDEFDAAANSLAGLIRRLEVGEEILPQELATWRDFCIALSTLSASKQQSVYGTRPYQPHRR